MPARRLLAFAIIYFVWGSTFLAIRVGVGEVPPFLLAGLRFGAAGGALFVWAKVRGEPAPRSREWLATVVLAFMIFVVAYGLLFWAEQRVTSGMAAVMAATIPLFTALAEITVLRTRRPTAGLALALLLGLGGVAVLTSRSLIRAGAPIDRAGAAALLVGAVSWSFATVLTKKVPLPATIFMRSATQMLAGGVMLVLAAAALGEFAGFRPAAVSSQAWLALAYLVVAGSIVAFTAYLWLVHHESPTRVGSYAYVNPVVAVLLGSLILHEPLTRRTILGSLLVLVSVAGVLTLRTAKPAATE